MQSRYVMLTASAPSFDTSTFHSRSSLLRIFFVYPGHTLYTHAQLVHVLSLSLVLNALFAALLVGQRQCSQEATLVPALAQGSSSPVLVAPRFLRQRCAR